MVRTVKELRWDLWNFSGHRLVSHIRYYGHVVNLFLDIEVMVNLCCQLYWCEKCHEFGKADLCVCYEERRREEEEGGRRRRRKMRRKRRKAKRWGR